MYQSSHTQLLSCRLLVEEESDNLVHVRLVHELVLDHWARASKWFESSREALQAITEFRYAAEQWEREKMDQAYLVLIPKKLILVGHLLYNWQDRLTKLMRDYLRQSLLTNYDPNREYTSALVFSAAVSGDLELLQHYEYKTKKLGRGTDFLYSGEGNAFLHAAYGGHLEIIDWLFSKVTQR